MSSIELDKESFYEKKYAKLIASTSIKMFPLFFISNTSHFVAIYNVQLCNNYADKM